VQACFPRASERGERALVQRDVLGDERPVEVARDDAEVAREVGRKDQPFGLPPVAFTT
jgi:hypothetical protein